MKNNKGFTITTKDNNKSIKNKSILINFKTTNDIDLYINLNTIYLELKEKKGNLETYNLERTHDNKSLFSTGFKIFNNGSSDDKSSVNTRSRVVPEFSNYHKILLNYIANPEISSKKYILKKSLNNKLFENNIKIHNDEIYINKNFLERNYEIETDKTESICKNKYVEYKTKYLIFKKFINTP